MSVERVERLERVADDAVLEALRLGDVVVDEYRELTGLDDAAGFELDQRVVVTAHLVAAAVHETTRVAHDLEDVTDLVVADDDPVRALGLQTVEAAEGDVAHPAHMIRAHLIRLLDVRVRGAARHWAASGAGDREQVPVRSASRPCR